MSRLLQISIAFTSLLACSTLVVGEDLANCGFGVQYYPSQYTCQDDNFLCPIIGGDYYLRCGDDTCYSTKQYSCATKTLQPFSPTGTNPLQNCSGSPFDPSTTVCISGFQFCSIVNGIPFIRCGDECYDPSKQRCALGLLYAVGTRAPTCIPEFGPDEYCNYYGCELPPCCPGLFGSGGKCRAF
ncbi:hypothetical protein R3P38DRAFT_1708576 [Favolaschia claudopus]|uniref:Endo-1,3(4)-beta-glucanase 1 carbohydrate binding domain-containing protein n=1 Tax=Favolaschia claudopus TaxID=2862362 RepID=A0AAW0AC23_9AGAR